LRETEILPVLQGRNRQRSIARAAILLNSGELVAFPTDTVYGVAAVANQPNAVARLYVAKGRPPEKAIPILIASLEDLDTVVTGLSERVHQLVNRFWPGGLTLILPKRETVPDQVSATQNVAVRLPDMILTREIITAVGSPLAVTSANRSGQQSPTTASEAFDQLHGRIAAIVDGGPTKGSVPSTILDCTTDPPRLIRRGVIDIDALRRFTQIA
jgi:L-threonylcarbamoyladenylate synthase